MDRFDLEQGIMHAWEIVDDINMVSARCKDPETTKLLESIALLYQMKFDNLFGIFEKSVNNGKLI